MSVSEMNYKLPLIATNILHLSDCLVIFLPVLTVYMVYICICCYVILCVFILFCCMDHGKADCSAEQSHSVGLLWLATGM